VDTLKTINPTAQCTRCGKPCRIATTRNAEARPIRKASRAEAKSGMCANCALTNFIQSTESLMLGITLRGPESLLDPRIQAGFTQLLQVGGADVDLAYIDWQWIVENWHLPFKPCKSMNL